MSRRRSSEAGFTLIEIMAALGILSIAVFILLDAHYTALRLQETTSEEVFHRTLLTSVLNQAEVAVYEGTLTDAGDFGERYPDYGWSYEATKTGLYEEVPLYLVRATITGPDYEETLEFQVFDLSIPEEGLPTTLTLTGDRL